FFRRHHALFCDTGQNGCSDARAANKDSEEHYAYGVCTHYLGHALATADWRHERSECSAEAQNHRHAERQSEVAHREAERQPANTPQQSEEKGPEDRRRRGLVQYREQVLREERSKN